MLHWFGKVCLVSGALLLKAACLPRLADSGSGRASDAVTSLLAQNTYEDALGKQACTNSLQVLVKGSRSTGTPQAQHSWLTQRIQQHLAGMGKLRVRTSNGATTKLELPQGCTFEQLKILIATQVLGLTQADSTKVQLSLNKKVSGVLTC